MSLDGFIAGPDISNDNPMGKGGLRLHDWMFAFKTDEDQRISAAQMEASGAVIIGRRMYETAIDGPWEGSNPFDMPVFVLTEEPPVVQVAGFTYVTNGIADALKKAREAAGEKDIWITGANVSQQYLRSNLIDELHIHIAPILLVTGTRLFENIGDSVIELENVSCVQTTKATHLVFKVIKNT